MLAFELGICFSGGDNKRGSRLEIPAGRCAVIPLDTITWTLSLDEAIRKQDTSVHLNVFMKYMIAFWLRFLPS